MSDTNPELVGAEARSQILLLAVQAEDALVLLEKCRGEPDQGQRDLCLESLSQVYSSIATLLEPLLTIFPTSDQDVVRIALTQISQQEFNSVEIDSLQTMRDFVANLRQHLVEAQERDIELLSLPL